MTLTFERAVTYGDVLTLDCTASRWGRTSFDVDVTGTVHDQVRFTARATYVSVKPTENVPVEIPDIVRRALT